ncbi:LysR substrate-binding domain-containing protein [Mucilaginibacter sp.]|jgi:DNA-binding transcriptional LysR family regulator|uniref:LysR substrate-binding domain-containing protein n=1 Tax=Mucilaginibacter sp. TaxID=1882438 RepID=UPI002C8EC50D|nr:LysR substrate-binding domain-containing protein [Mucilaginibacter sp.]HTI60611.1 LysR substrate-binding domain-containing protein [Mucilaginibacter sp.]
MIFDFRLRVFYTVAQRLSFTKAAGELFITQPAVTKHIRELEHQLNTQLFKRNGNNITLTTAGKVLLQYAEKIFQTYAEMETELAQLSNIEAGTLHIGASTTVAQTILPRLLALFKKTYPAIAFTFTQANTDQVTQQVLSDKIDIAIVEGAAHYPQITYTPFAKDEIVLVTRAGNQLAKKAEITPKQLPAIPLVLREAGSGTLDVIFNAMAGVQINPKDLNIEIQLESSIAIKEYLLYSETATFLSIQSVVSELKYNELTVIDIKGLDIFRTFEFIQLQGKYTRLTELFKRFCISNYNLK